MLKIYAKVFPYVPQEGSDSKLLAMATLELGGALKVSDVTIRQSENGPFVSMPSFKNKDGEFKEICHPVTKELREAISETVLDAYKRDSKYAVRNGDTNPSLEVSVNKLEQDKVKAIGSVTLGGAFRVNGITVRENVNGNLFVCMPSTSYEKDGGKVYKDICSPAGEYAEKGTIVGTIINKTKDLLNEKGSLEAQVAAAEETKKAQTKKSAAKSPSKSTKKKNTPEKEER